MSRIKMTFVLSFLFFFVQILCAQTDFSSAMLKTLRGAMVSFSSLTQKDSVILVCFWASSSDASIDELNAINAHYEKWKAQVRFRMMAISVDDGKAANKVKPTVNMNGWTFDVFTDIKGDLQKMLNSNNLPQSMIIRGGKVIYRQSGYQPGSENYLFQRIQAFAAEGR